MRPLRRPRLIGHTPPKHDIADAQTHKDLLANQLTMHHRVLFDEGPKREEVRHAASERLTEGSRLGRRDGRRVLAVGRTGTHRLVRRRAEGAAVRT